MHVKGLSDQDPGIGVEKVKNQGISVGKHYYDGWPRIGRPEETRWGRSGDWTKSRNLSDDSQELLHDPGWMPIMGNMETVDDMTNVLNVGSTDG